MFKVLFYLKHILIIKAIYAQLKAYSSWNPYFSRFHRWEYWCSHINSNIWSFTASCYLLFPGKSASLLPCLSVCYWKSSGSLCISCGTVTVVVSRKATGGQQFFFTPNPHPGEDAAMWPRAFLKWPTLKVLHGNYTEPGLSLFQTLGHALSPGFYRAPCRNLSTSLNTRLITDWESEKKNSPRSWQLIAGS